MFTAGEPEGTRADTEEGERMLFSGKVPARTAVACLLAGLLAAAILLPVPGTGAAPVEGADPVMEFAGTGRGHGVGLCMDGVLYRALDGQSYRDIINYYYTGVSFGRDDDSRPVRVKGRDGVIRDTTMRDYLYRLTEEPESWPLEGLKVLFVAARTYTISVINRDKHAAEGFDICSFGSCCQASDENKDLSKFPNHVAAVDATSGEIITYDNKPIIAAYDGACGGHTENNNDVWGPTPVPYLRGKPCTYCSRSPRFHYGVSMRKSEFEALLNSSAETRVGKLLSIDLSERTPGGRVRQARLVGTDDTRVVPGSTIAKLLGLPNTRFHLASPGFEQYLAVLNPNPEATTVTFTFMRPDGSTTAHVEQLESNSRYTLKVNDLVQSSEFSTRIDSELPVVAERALYFNYQGISGGSASLGSPDTSETWYFAEGYTGDGFDTYILVENPSTEEAEVRFTFMLPGGRTVIRETKVPPTSRFTANLGTIRGLEDEEVSTLVESLNGVGIVADRAVYFDYHGITGGNAEAGATSTSDRWFLAEGYAGGAFDTYVVIQNPTGEVAEVEAVFMREDGRNVTETFSLPPGSRHTIDARKVESLPGASFSTGVVSTNGTRIIVERAMYFNYQGIEGGHDGRAAPSPLEEWFFAEGYTGGSFDTWITVQNPGSKAAEIRARFTTSEGEVHDREYTVKGRSRLTISVDRVEGLEDAEVSTAITSLNGVGVVAERSMYFRYPAVDGERPGGHSVCGAGHPSRLWYFAEGYTGN